MRSLVCLVFAACSGAPGAHHPVESPRHERTPAVVAVTERECDALIDHAVDLGLTEEPRATDADRESVRASLHADFARDCRALPRDRYQCAISARTLAELTACQPMPSSSTSNSSVAPGGITPPAPRSP